MTPQKARILVVGSSNTDMVIKVASLPRPGQTIIGTDFSRHHGGKGANQAVAAARAGAEVNFLSCLGQDSFDDEALIALTQDSINTANLKRVDSCPSGTAFVLVDARGENTVTITAGANQLLTPEDILAKEALIKTTNCLLMQLEIPLETVCTAAKLAKAYACPIILNPAPASKLPEDLLQQLDFITPNQTEMEILTGIAVKDERSAAEAARVLRAQGVKTVIITLGKAGAFYMTETKSALIAAPPVTVVDSTAAGDTFNGVLSVKLAEGATLAQAITFANAAAALSVTKAGAQSSIPYDKDIQAFIKAHRPLAC